MQYFIGIVPPIEYRKKIIDLQKHWKNNLLPEVVEPHITVKAQSGLVPETNWLSVVKEICMSFPVFKVSLKQPTFFGEEVLYLGTDSKEIKQLHQKLVEAVSPSKELIEKYFELDDYTPHLTLAQTNLGLTTNELKKMAIIAEKRLKPYPTFEVSYVRAYKEVEPNKYIRFLDLPLKRRAKQTYIIS